MCVLKVSTKINNSKTKIVGNPSKIVILQETSKQAKVINYFV